MTTSEYLQLAQVYATLSNAEAEMANYYATKQNHAMGELSAKRMSEFKGKVNEAIAQAKSAEG